jgi:hypothetical protein
VFVGPAVEYKDGLVYGPGNYRVPKNAGKTTLPALIARKINKAAVRQLADNRSLSFL